MKAGKRRRGFRMGDSILFKDKSLKLRDDLNAKGDSHLLKPVMDEMDDMHKRKKGMK